jgi:Spy/CpxP family protein refolding chaperone
MAVASPFFTATGLKADPSAQNPRAQRNVFQTYPGLNELMESYTRILNLTPDQQKKIRAIHVRHYQKRIQDYDTGNDVRNHQEQLQSEVRKVLTPEQQTVYDSTFVLKTTDG